MDLKAILMARADGQCELCEGTKDLDIYQIEPAELAVSECQILTCSICREGLEGKEVPAGHWDCLNKSSQSDYTSVQVVSWRILKHLADEQAWAKELLNSFSFDELTLEWAQANS